MGKLDVRTEIFTSVRLGGLTLKRKVLTGFLASILVVSGLMIPASVERVEAQTLNEIRAKKAENEEKKKQNQSELSKVRDEKASIEKQVNQIDAQMTVTTEKIVKNQEQIIQNQAKMEELEVEIDEAEIRIAERDKILKERVRSMHVNGGVISYLEVLLGAQSFGDFLDRVLALNIIAEQDRDIIEAQKADKVELEENKAEVEKLVEKTEAEQKELEALKAELQSQLEEKAALVEKLEEQEEHLHAEYEELENKDKLIAEEEAAFKRLQEQQAREAKEKAKKQSSSSNGSKKQSTQSEAKQVTSSSGFIFPTTGQISPGNRFRTSSRPNHNGVDIASQAKPPVYAVADGEVTRVVDHCPSFAKPRRDRCGGGYGNHVVITHNVNGQIVSTLYAHFDQGSVRVNKGQFVSQGTVIGNQGNSGSTGGSTGIHLHFEVHPGGYRGPSSAVNPCSWIGC